MDFCVLAEHVSAKQLKYCYFYQNALNEQISSYGIHVFQFYDAVIQFLGFNVSFPLLLKKYFLIWTFISSWIFEIHNSPGGRKLVLWLLKKKYLFKSAIWQVNIFNNIMKSNMVHWHYKGEIGLFLVLGREAKLVSKIPIF